MLTKTPTHLQRTSQRRFYVWLVAGGLLFLAATLSLSSRLDLQSIGAVRQHRHKGPHPRPAYWHATDAVEIIKAIYKPSIIPITAPEFTDEDGNTYRIKGEPTYKVPLGKRLLVVDIDSRPMTDEGQLLSKKGPHWPRLDGMTAGMLSHYLFAMIHGYDYKFIRAPTYTDRYATWSKVPMLKEALQNYEYVLFMDQDAIFRYPVLPLEWLMNHWGHTPKTLFMMSDEPVKDYNRHPNGKPYFNTGFIIAQNSTRIHDLIDAWEECPRESRYPGCGKWAHEWPHEQAALVGFVLEDFNDPDDLRSVPCNEANGSPMTVDAEGCAGTLIRHFWREGKGHQPEEFADNVLRYFLPNLQEAFRSDIDNTLVDHTKFKLKGKSSG